MELAVGWAAARPACVGRVELPPASENQ